MRPETKTVEQIIRDTVALYTHHPEELSVLLVGEYSDGAAFDLQTCRDDHHKLIGKNGANIRALSLIVSALFPESPIGYRIVREIMEPKPGERAKFMPLRKVEDYDTAPAVKRLSDLLEKILVDSFVVVAEPQHGEADLPTFVFAVIPQSEDDLEFLQGVGLDAKPAAALDTLWRAFGAKEGCAFRVEARER